MQIADNLTTIRCILIGLILFVGNGRATVVEQSPAPTNNAGDGVTTDCQNSTAHRVEVAFTTKIIRNEYIVAFNDYYKQSTRETYVRASLNGSNVRFENEIQSSHKVFLKKIKINQVRVKILPRLNPASDYPSDFDLIILEEDASSNGLAALLSHPFIRSVTPHRMVHRTLKYVPLTKTEESQVQQNIDTTNAELDDAEHKLLQELFDKVCMYAFKIMLDV